MGKQSYIAFRRGRRNSFCPAGLSNALLRFTGELIGRGRGPVLPSLVGWALPFSAVLGGAGAAGSARGGLARGEPSLGLGVRRDCDPAGVLSSVPGSILLGTQQWRQFADVVLVIGAASVAATVVVLELGGGISGMLAVIAAAAVARYAWMAVLTRRQLAGSLGPVRQPLGQMRSKILVFSLAMSVPVILGLVVNQRSEFFFLERFSSDRQIALYSIAFSATAALIAIPRAISAILTPSVATLIGSGEFDRIRIGFSRVLRLSLLFGLPLTGAGLALGPDLLHLVYGRRYEGAGNVLLIVMPTLPLTALAGASSALLVGYGRVRAPIVVSGIAAVADLALAAILVPRLDAIGAGIANTGAFLLNSILLVGVAVRVVGGVHLGWSSVLRIATISAAAAGAARLVLVGGDGPEMFVLATAVELATLGVGAMVVRAVPEDDATFLIRVAGRRGRFARVLERVSDRSLRAPA